ncbi:MAG: ComEC/Rec2 family competence protein [Aquihabitans sp.]
MTALSNPDPLIPDAIDGGGRPLTDRGAVVLAAAVVLGAWWHKPVPLIVGVMVGLVAAVLRRPTVLVLGAFLVASTLGTRSFEGITAAEPGSYSGPVTLLSDPKETPYGVRVDVRAGNKRFELNASQSAAGAVGRSLAGERLSVEGRLRTRPDDMPWLIPRHVVGRLTVSSAERLDGGSAPWRAANRFRRLLGRGAEVMDEPARSLYGGFVLGDDRGQTPELIDDFRGAGLTHLLVVSGQNVAFLLVLAGPLIRRQGLAGRWLVTIWIIGAFAVLTRFEPSVLRASAMAAIAVTATVAGRPSSTLRNLSLAVAVLVLIDPLLVWSVAFQLSTAASAGIAVLGPRIAGALRGPRWWREALGVTLAAQLGVAPVLVPRFGGLPVVSVVANLLAVPVAGLVTTWGLPAGVVAGIFGSPVAAWVHLPTRFMIGWVAGVARVSSALPLGEVGTRELVVIVAAAWVAATVHRHRPERRAIVAMLLSVAVLAALTPALALRSPPADVVLAGGSRIQRRQGATLLILDASSSPTPLLQDLRRAGVRRIDVVHATTEPRPEVMRALRHRWPVGPVIVTPVDR